jgi:hypothetical protein
MSVAVVADGTRTEYGLGRDSRTDEKAGGGSPTAAEPRRELYPAPSREALGGRHRGKNAQNAGDRRTLGLKIAKRVAGH